MQVVFKPHCSHCGYIFNSIVTMREDSNKDLFKPYECPYCNKKVEGLIYFTHTDRADGSRYFSYHESQVDTMLQKLEKEANWMLYDVYDMLKRMIERGQIEWMDKKLDACYAASKITEEQYKELTAMLDTANKSKPIQGKTHMTDKIVLLVGRSGSGKSTVASILESEYGRTAINSYTTRPKRHPDEHGHIFVDRQAWENTRREYIVAHTHFDGHDYWATKDQVEEHDIYIIDPDGVQYFRSHYFGSKKAVVIWLDCSARVALQRMLNDPTRSLQACWERCVHDEAKFFSPLLVQPDMIIHVDDKTPEEIAKEIEEVFES